MVVEDPDSCAACSRQQRSLAGGDVVACRRVGGTFTWKAGDGGGGEGGLGQRRGSGIAPDPVGAEPGPDGTVSRLAFSVAANGDGFAASPPPTTRAAPLPSFLPPPMPTCVPGHLAAT